MSGGNTLFPGMLNRLGNEVRALASSMRRIRVAAPPPFSVWSTGSSISSYSNWITRAEYNESGPNIVHRKCF
jgi:actin beta/gamma 1